MQHEQFPSPPLECNSNGSPLPRLGLVGCGRPVDGADTLGLHVTSNHKLSNRKMEHEKATAKHRPRTLVGQGESATAPMSQKAEANTSSLDIIVVAPALAPMALGPECLCAAFCFPHYLRERVIPKAPTLRETSCNGSSRDISHGVRPLARYVFV